jgi:3-dehydroquinate dehydratase type I
MMVKPKICAVITSANANIIENADPHADLFELRIDMIGSEWASIIPLMHKPWIATCRLKSEGGAWDASEARRKEEILKALNCGASLIDLELETPNLDRLVSIIKKKSRLILSCHNYNDTPPLKELEAIARREFEAGADIAKIATRSSCSDDTLRVLQVRGNFTDKEMITIAMGEQGILSRVLDPLMGSPFAYAAAAKGEESAEGQFTACELHKIYSMMRTQ